MGPGQIAATVAELAAPAAEMEGLDLLHVEFRKEGRGWILRLYIDRDGGVNLDDCARMSRQVSGMLEDGNLIDSPYHLEVSSPGLNRPLFRKEDYTRFRGHRARVKLKKPIEGRKRLIGLIGKADDRGFTITDDEEKDYEILWEQVDRANLEYQG